MTDSEIMQSENSLEDKILMILSNNCDFGNPSGAMVSVNKFGQVAESVIELIQSQLSEVREENKRLTEKLEKAIWIDGEGA